MQSKCGFVGVVAVALAGASMVLTFAAAASAADYVFSDLALTPGADASGLNFNWTTPDGGSGQCIVEIAKASTGFKNSTVFSGTKAAADTNGDGSAEYYYCAATIAGLNNQVDYVYRLGDNNGLFSDTYYYSTQNRNKYGFVFLSDAQIGATELGTDTTGWANTVSAIHSYFPETAFILSAGDHIERPGNESEWAGFFSPDELSSIPVAPTPGAHDELGNGRGFAQPSSFAYDYHFNLPNETAHLFYKSWQTAAGDYYFTYGDVLFLVLTMDSHDYASHYGFMQEAIEANPGAKWRIAAWHYTIYTAAGRGTMPAGAREALVPMMDALDIDVVLMGHDHTYCRTHQMFGFYPQAVQTNDKGEVVNPTGTVYLSANSASGSKFYALAPDVADPIARPWIAAYGQPNVPSFSYIDVDANSLNISTYLTDTMQAVDTYTIRKVD